MSDDITPDELWPEHAGHAIRYNEIGWVTYRLTALSQLDEYEGYQIFEIGDDQRESVNAEIQEIEVFCATCGGTPLSLERKLTEGGET